MASVSALHKRMEPSENESTLTRRSLIVRAFFAPSSLPLEDPSAIAKASRPFWYVSQFGMTCWAALMSLIIISYVAPYSSYMKSMFI